MFTVRMTFAPINHAAKAVERCGRRGVEPMFGAMLMRARRAERSRVTIATTKKKRIFLRFVGLC